MKRLILVLILLPSLASAQQLLWTTFKTERTESKYIPIERAPMEVLDLYGMYSRFYDGTGFSKESYIKMFVDSETPKAGDFGDNESFESVIIGIKEPTVFAFKLNDGTGSYASVIYVDENDVEVIVFSNSLIMANMEYTGSYNVNNFKKLFFKLFKDDNKPTRTADPDNKGSDPLAANYGEGGSGFGYASLSLENRRFVVPPKIEDAGKLSGKVAVEIRVDRDGKILSARAGVRGTTITSNEIFEKCERAALGAQLNRLEKAPPVQTGVIVFNFKIDYKSQ